MEKVTLKSNPVNGQHYLSRELRQQGYTGSVEQQRHGIPCRVSTEDQEREGNHNHPEKTLKS